MNLKQIPMWGTLGAWALCGSLTTLQEARAIPAEEDQQPQQEGAETLTRGPVHEAFAETVSYNPVAGIIVKKEPPANIEEVPPDQQLVGNNVSWIPGYWGWEDEGSDFIWISGIWRNLPPGRQWVPGYWNPIDAGYQWVSGYWSDAQTEEVAYLPEPPASLENGPSVEASSSDQVWTPGSWVYQEDRYAWSPGYWQAAQPDWTWMPAHYSWTPHGYVFVPGYWDYDVPRRGVLFAPVRFAPDYYSRPGFVYSPVTVISLVVFAEHLFLRPNYCHYYYGDYYAPRYRDSGFYAPYAYYSDRRRGFDPIFAKEIWQNRKDRNWLRQREADFLFRRDNENARPPRTWGALQALARNPDAKDARAMAFVKPFSQYTKDAKGPQRFKPLAAPDKERFLAQKQEMVKFAADRRKLEGVTKGAGAEAPKRTTVEKTKFERSPIFGRAADKLAKGEAPPKLPPMRKIDPKAMPGGVPDTRGPDRKGDDTAMDERGKPGPKTDLPNDPREGKGIRPKGNDQQPKEPGNETIPRRKATPNEAPQGVPDRTPRVDPEKTPKVEPKKVMPREEPEKKQVEPRKVVPQDTPRREVPEPERKIVPKPEPKVMPKPEPKVVPRPEPKVMPTPQPKVQPQPKQVVPKGPAVNPAGDGVPQRRGNDRRKDKDKDN
ncbi:YXWGXW repeat-containing protein [Luteolibacter ambystomatis]|uniref:YXWGXW repeat-containing protein n=1 Tax=Luteolibacter ambystomatis TaxID=2824561 RepID=A0A975G897_9BACT|nr:YXWGXW repeat-containing protein [Luteolibacter ambystomatis]QUE50555.1 YXWGXW repeat-containing protein [Luteolibacter ambystomatis]